MHSLGTRYAFTGYILRIYWVHMSSPENKDFIIIIIATLLTFIGYTTTDELHVYFVQSVTFTATQYAITDIWDTLLQNIS